MINKAKRALVNALSRASAEDHPVAVKHKDKSLALILPVEDYQKFQAAREERLKLMQQEFDGLLALVRRYTGRQSLEEVEAQLAALRKEIEEAEE
ncbi:MAG: hypothetical protein JXM69_03655 [Anaerolineae bacterium]|nr:hypothetical protein [Anaerolineae bacterium]